MRKKITTQKKEISQPILKIALKFLAIIAFISVGISYAEYKNFFAPDNSNNHSLKKWDSFYQFTEKNDVFFI